MSEKSETNTGTQISHLFVNVVLTLTNSVIYNVYITNGSDHELPKVIEIRCSGNSEHFLRHIWHPS